MSSTLRMLFLIPLLGLVLATDAQAEVTDSIIDGTGRYSLPVEPPLVSDDTSIIQITIITDTPLPDTTLIPSITNSGPGVTSAPTPVLPTPVPLPSPISSSTDSSPTESDTVTTPTGTPSDDAPSANPSTSTPNPAATVTGLLHNAAGIALVAAVGLGIAI